tara:strand:- start:1953 stop:2195 length:243 start_codon:yes stop_codon:yes gene_type:complete
MAHKFEAKSFITDATALDNTQTDGRGVDSVAKQVEDYLTLNDAGGSGSDIDEVIAVTSCKLKGDRVFTLVVIEDEYSGGE